MLGVLAIGYEGPETLGTVVAAAATLVAPIVLILLLIRGLVLVSARPRKAGRRDRG